MTLPEDCALLIIDIQNDFMPDGPLPVPEGDQVIPVVNNIEKLFQVVLAAQDWHPAGHGSFASAHGKQPGEVIDLNGLEQELWPDHSVQETEGAEFVEELELDRVRKVFRKGIDPLVDSYGAFYDNGWRRSTGLKEWCDENGIKHLYVAGLATEYCVKYTVLDGLKLGYEMTLIADGCRAVNWQPEDEVKAIEEMKAAGANVITSDQLLATHA